MAVTPVPPALRDIGLSYRQLDYWTTKGWLIADVASPGHGHRRHWARFEIGVAARMVLLIDAGFTAPAAADYARRFGSCLTVKIGPDLALTLWEDQ